MDGYYGNLNQGNLSAAVDRIYEKITATAGQTLVTFSTVYYSPKKGELAVYVNGNYKAPDSYIELTSSSILLSTPLSLNDEIVIEWLKKVTSFATDGTQLRADLMSTSGGFALSMIGITPTYTSSVTRTLSSKMLDFVSIADFGVIGDGSDESGKIQQALMSGARNIFVPAGTYCCAGLWIYSNTRLYGEGASSIFMLPNGAAINTTILQNANPTPYLDGNIYIENMVFDGNNNGSGGTQTRFTCILALNYVYGAELTNLIVKNVQYQGLALAGCQRVKVLNCEFTGLGYQGTTTNGGSAIWCATIDNSYLPTDITVKNCYFHDNNWHGMQYTGVKIQLIGNTFFNNKEAHVFAPAGAANGNQVIVDFVIADNVFDTVTKKDISSHALELCGRHLSITGNVIRMCDHGGIALTDVHYVTVSGNTIGNVNRIYASTTGIDIMSVSESCTHINITGNNFYDDTGTVTASYAIRYTKNYAGAVNISTLMIAHNVAQTAWAGGSSFSLGTLGSNCKILSNIGPGTSDTTT